MVVIESELAEVVLAELVLVELVLIKLVLVALELELVFASSCLPTEVRVSMAGYGSIPSLPL